jgi:hypothetical protein
MFDPAAGGSSPEEPGHHQPAPPVRDCPFCGGTVPAQAVACPRCGRPLAQAAQRNSPVSSVRQYAPGVGLVTGGLLIALSPVLGWLRVSLFGGVTLFDLARLPSNSAVPFVLLPTALVVCGVAGVVLGLGLRYGTAARVTAAVLGLLAGAGGGLLLADLAHAAAEANGLLGLGAGVWLELAGAVIMLTGAVVPAPSGGPVVFGSRTWRQVAPVTAVFLVVTLMGLGFVAVSSTGQLNAAEAALPPPAATLPTTPTPLAPAAPVPTVTQTPTTSTGALSAAQALVESKGYTPASNTTWERVAGLNVVLGTLTESADGYNQLAFFFYDGRYLGTDTSASSAGIQQAWADDHTIALAYALYHPDDPMCCPTAGAATVRYQWTGNRLRALDPIPSADPGAATSRR